MAKIKKGRFLIFVFLATVLVFGLIFLWPIFRFNKERSNEIGYRQEIGRVAPAHRVKKVKPGFRLYIPKLKIKAPIIANVNGNDKERYFKALEKGVAHYANTALPGENGNIFIFGHSNFYRDRPGRYKRVFARLNRLKSGDQIKIHYRQREYKYIVSQTRLIGPRQVEVLRRTKKERLTLMTCWPPGTTEKRLIVVCRKG